MEEEVLQNLEPKTDVVAQQRVSSMKCLFFVICCLVFIWMGRKERMSCKCTVV